MKFLSLVGNSFGCSASGERLVSAARDGDFQEAKALLEYNPRLARYSTFGVRNSPLHYSAAQGHHEIVSLLLESGVDINLRNYRGQTALMQACQYGHWEVVQTLILFKANIHKADYLNGGTALHLAALNGHSRCIRILLADYIPSIPNIYDIVKKKVTNEDIISEFDGSALYQVVNRPADGGITSLHMAALNGHAESVQLLLDLGASVNEVTIEDGSTIDLIERTKSRVQTQRVPNMVPVIGKNVWCTVKMPSSTGLGVDSLGLGAGSTPLHYAACGGNAQCCQILVANGASLTVKNANGWTPLMVAHSWHREGLDEILSKLPEKRALPLSSPYLCLPLMSIVKIARECGWRSRDSILACVDPCVVCLERKCTVAVEGCSHEFCTQCALYLCSTNTSSTIARGSPGSIACPLCRHGIVSFVKLATTTPPLKELSRTSSLSLSFCVCSSDVGPTSLETPFCKPEYSLSSLSLKPISSSQRLSSIRLNSGLCMGTPDTNPCLVPRGSERDQRAQIQRCSRSGYRRTTSHSEGRKSWLCSFNQCVVTGSGY